MSDYIDTREGWREVTADEWFTRAHDTGYLKTTDEGGERYWVREEPVPALPTKIATLDGDDLIFVSDVLRALGKWKRAQQ